jgi:predicted nucleotidyltransferase
MQELFEYFDKRVQVKYRKSSTKWEGTFGIDNNLYRIYFNRFASSEWTVDFTYIKETGEETYLPTGTGRAMTVLSTVFNEIADFLADVDPDMLSFSGRNDTGQARLYARIMKSFLAPKALALGYDIDSADNGTYVEFVIIKPGYVENNDLYEGESEMDILDLITQAIIENVENLEGAWLFGSRTNGTFRPDSDWDILVVTSSGDPETIEEIHWHLSSLSFDHASVDFTVASRKDVEDDTTVASKARTEGRRIL